MPLLKLRGYRYLLAVPLCIFLFSGCTKETAVAIVNGEAITQNDIRVVLRLKGVNAAPKTTDGEDPHAAIYPQVIDQLINEKLMIQEAREKKITAGKDEVANKYNEIVKAFPKEEDYLKKLKERGLSRSVIIQSIEKDLIMEKLKESLSGGTGISEKELQDFYEKNRDGFKTTEKLRLSIIKAGTIEEARKIRKDIERGAEFEDIADKHPAGHADKGGETGWITLNTFPRDIAREIKKIKAGSIGGPIKGREGYYLIKVQEREEERIKSLDEVREDIKQVIMKKRRVESFHTWLQDARRNAKIEILKKA